MNTNALAVVRSLEVKAEVHHDACESKTFHTFLEHYTGMYRSGFHIPDVETIRNELERKKQFPRGQTPSILLVDELGYIPEGPTGKMIGRGFSAPIYMLDVAGFQPNPTSIREIREEQETQIAEERDTGNQMLAALSQISEGVTTISSLLNSGKLTRELFTRTDAKTLIDAFCAGAIQTAEAMDLVVTIENEATQPYAMGSYMPVVHVRDSNPFYRREMAEQRAKEAKNPHTVTKEQVGFPTNERTAFFHPDQTLTESIQGEVFKMLGVSPEVLNHSFSTAEVMGNLMGIDPGGDESHSVFVEIERLPDGTLKITKIRDAENAGEMIYPTKSPVVLGHPLPDSVDAVARGAAVRIPTYHGRPLSEVMGKPREPMAMFHDEGYQHPYATKTGVEDGIFPVPVVPEEERIYVHMEIDTRKAQQLLDEQNGTPAYHPV